MRKLYVDDEVKVKVELIKTLYFSSSIYLEDEIKRPFMFLKKNIGTVIESDWDKRKQEWSHFVFFKDKKTKEEIYLWFLESELDIV